MKSSNTFMEFFRGIPEIRMPSEELRDEDLCPYIVWDTSRGSYWFSPVSMEAVVIQRKEGHA